MPRNCKCDGQYVLLTGRNKFYFRARCNKCGTVAKQRKRLPAKKVSLSTQD